MKVVIAVVFNTVICIVYLSGLCLINRLAPIAHPNVAYGLTMIAWTSMLFAIQFLLLFLVLFQGKKCVLAPLVVPCIYALSIVDVYPKRAFIWLFMLLVLYGCYYIVLTKYIIQCKNLLDRK